VVFCDNPKSAGCAFFALNNSRTLLHNLKNEQVMSIKKQFIKTKPVCKVTFSIDAPAAGAVAVVGDFNNWDVDAGALGKLKSGAFKGTFEVNKDADYEFRYVVDGVYTNEPEADSYRWNAYANAENSVLAV
jgi:1,4-alpha-glucan branching enzyme